MPSRSSGRALALSLAGLAAFLAWQAFALRTYLRVERRPPSWDQAVQLDIALDHRQALAAGRWSDVLYLQGKSGMPPFPPLYGLALTRAYDSPDPALAALWVNWFYLAVLTVSLFGLAWEFRPDATALAAAVVFASAPAVQDLYVTQLCDLSVIAWAPAAYWALVRARGFARWRPSLAFGLLFAIGMLHKWSFFSYLIPAYFVGLGALRDPKRRPQALAALGLAAALMAPWYAKHAFRLLPTLIQGSSDAAVPFWKHGAFFVYFFLMGTSLGPFFWILGCAALLSPRGGRRPELRWLMTAWAATSYAFWAIVPNRQMRYLAPGLPGLAVAAASAWPGALSAALAAFQLAAGANYLTGTIPSFRIPAPLQDIVLFPSHPPSGENWRLEEILREAERRADPTRPIANLTLIANDRYFNGPTLAWTDRRLGLAHVRVRGVNARLCELSQFLLLKDGDLGPASVIGDLPERAAQVKRADGWFARAYAPAARWPLPDGSTAVLYQQKKLAAPPVRPSVVSFPHFSASTLEADGLKLDLGRWDPALGAYPRARLTVSTLTLRGLPLRGLDFELENLSFVPLEVPVGGAPPRDARLLRLDGLTARAASVDAASLRRFLEARVPGLTVESLEIDGTLRARARLRGVPISVELVPRLLDSPRRLRVELLKLSVAGVPLPTEPFNRLKQATVPLDPNPETPFAIRAAGLTLKNGVLSIPWTCPRDAPSTL